MMSYTATHIERNNRTVDGGNLRLRNTSSTPSRNLCGLIATLEGFSREELDVLAVESQTEHNKR